MFSREWRWHENALNWMYENNWVFMPFPLNQGSSNPALEGQCTAELSSNPDQTYLAVIS